MLAAVGTTHVVLTFRPTAKLVNVVRKFVSEFYIRVFPDADGISRVAMATHELLENATKYSKDGETTLTIGVDPSSSPQRVTIELSNRAEPADIAAIQEIVEGMGATADPQTYYLQLMRASLSKQGSGLGLARICAEGEMELRYHVDRDLVTTFATTHVGGQG